MGEMIISAALAILLAPAGPMAVVKSLGVNSSSQSMNQILEEPVSPAEVLNMNPNRSTVSDVDPQGEGEVRRRPRISKTRCAMSGCEPQCNIKGIKNTQGNWVYLVPSSPEYARTDAERLFCGQMDAKNAGYRETQS